jgi:fibronectin type 3 domain-containing protein
LIRSVSWADGNPVESDDSVPAIVTPRDTFPPAVPRNVVAAVLPGADGGQVVDLSWSINVEPDLAGYRIYRSEKPGERGQSLLTELLATPAYRDSALEAGHRYWYSVTAVDREGNESGTSVPTLADLTQPSP